MQDRYILHDNDELDKPDFTNLQNPQEEEIQEPAPSIDDIITASESDWRRLCALADADPATMQAFRVRHQLKASGQLKPKRRRTRRRSRPSTSTRNWSAGSVLQSQAQIGSAMVETVERVNSGELDGDEKSRSILVTAGDEFKVMEVVA